MTIHDPARLLVGGKPRSVITPARIARAADRALLDEYRRKTRGMDPELDQWLSAMHIAGLEWAEHRATTAAATAESGSRTLPQIERVPSSTHDDLDVAAVARRLGCKERNVRDLIARRRLPARKVSGCWVVTPEELDGYLANRPEPTKELAPCPT